MAWPRRHGGAGRQTDPHQTGQHQCTVKSGVEQDNFDVSESFEKSPQYQKFLEGAKCEDDGYIPAITLTIDGEAKTFEDKTQTLNDGGLDPDICFGKSEYRAFVEIFGGSTSD